MMIIIRPLHSNRSFERLVALILSLLLQLVSQILTLKIPFIVHTNPLFSKLMTFGKNIIIFDPVHITNANHQVAVA